MKLLIFNTHGESIGRGGHPISLTDRLNYVNCSYTRKKIKVGNTTCSRNEFSGWKWLSIFYESQFGLCIYFRILEFCLNDKTL